jgi:hypothetical protein
MMVSPEDGQYVGLAFIAPPWDQRDRLYQLAEAGGGKMPAGLQAEAAFPGRVDQAATRRPRTAPAGREYITACRAGRDERIKSRPRPRWNGRLLRSLYCYPFTELTI